MFLVLAWTTIHGPVNTGTVEHSFGRAADGPFGVSCESAGQRRWRCSADTGSSAQAYDLAADDGSCWHAAARGRDVPSVGARLHGCIYLLRDG